MTTLRMMAKTLTSRIVSLRLKLCDELVEASCMEMGAGCGDADAATS
jgi:hypothetical protein